MNEKIIILLLFIIGFTLIFISKGQHLEEGNVIGKIYLKETSNLELVPSAGGGMRPQVVHKPEKWVLVIQDQDKQGKCYVSEEEWNHVEIGVLVKCKTGDGLVILNTNIEDKNK
jgi:hypothetical protein